MAAKPAIIILSNPSFAIAQKIADRVDGEIHGFSPRVGEDVGVRFTDVKAHIRALFGQGRPIVAVMAAGALIRLLAPVLVDKSSEPPVLAVADDGSAVVPLLGGHRGANALAREIAGELDGCPAITTAGDIRFGLALDDPPPGWVLTNPDAAKTFMADMVGGAAVAVEGGAPWLSDSLLAIADNASHRITVTEKAVPAASNQLIYHPKSLVVGVGCERGCDADEVLALVKATLEEAELAAESVAAVVSIDVKADEAAIHAACDYLGVPARFFDAQRLERETSRLENPSDIVFTEVGCHGVAEGAALAAVGDAGALVVAKRKSRRATCAIARAPEVLTQLSGRARGTLFVVGIGPGGKHWRSPEVTAMVEQSSDLVGYSLYLDLLGPLVDGKQRHDFDLGREEDRVRHAMELAGTGRTVCLVCSGDAGIYAMATLVYELIDKGGVSDAARRIAVVNSPGISALQAAAARAGAPLGHDFCTISLSDLLTPWEDIQRRVRAAGSGDFVVAFYNPVSKKRRSQLAWARDELLTHRPKDTPVVLATNLGRNGETVRIVPLSDLAVDDVDMLTVVVVGSSDSRVVQTGDGKTWVYTPRGYSGKQGTRMV